MKKLQFYRGQEPYIIAEIGQTHDGNINIAHAFIDAIAKTGANAIKFQTHIASEESTPDEPWRVKFSYQDQTRYDYWQRMEFSETQWLGLKNHADEKGLHFLSSPFSIAAVELLERINVPAWKIGSGEVLSERMLNAMAKTGKTIIMSSGMSDLAEIDGIISRLKARDAEHALMHCTTAYPTQAEQIGINMIAEYKERYDCPIGLSDHSGTIWPSIAAASHGAELIEVHVTMDRDMFGPDVSSSITTHELKHMVEGIRFVNKMVKHPVDKSTLDENKLKMRQLFMKSLVARNDLSEGTVLEEHHIIEKKPGTGIPAQHLERFIGQKLLYPIKKDTQFSWDHIGTQEN